MLSIILNIVIFCVFSASLFAFGSPTSICHDGDVDLIIVTGSKLYSFPRIAPFIEYFAKRESNATGDLRAAIVDTFICRFVLEFTMFSSLQQMENKMQNLFPEMQTDLQLISVNCELFPFLKKHIDKSREKKTFLIYQHYFVVALDFIKSFPNLSDMFPFVFHIVDGYYHQFYNVDHFYYKRKQNILYHFDLDIIGAKFCGVCPQGWIHFTSSQKPHVSSCYFLDTKNTPISWIDARDKCTNKESLLVSFETYEELKYVFNALSLHLVQPLEDKLIYIGLISKRNGGVNIFRWTSGGPFTLFFKHSENFSKHYEREMCIILKCVTDNNKLGKNITPELCNNQNIELLTIRCNKEITNLFICELEMARTLYVEDDIIKIPYLETNINNKEFVKIRNNIVSVSNKEHKSPEFKFDCGDNIQHVPYGAVCDMVFDCDNGKDEEYCYEKPQRKTYDKHLFTCYRGFSRISFSMKCDNIIDCLEGSDEIICKKKVSQMYCSDETYVPIAWLRGKKDVHCYLCNEFNYTNYEMTYKNKGTDQSAFPPELKHGVTICDETPSNKGETVSHCENKLHNKIWTPSCLYIRRSTSVSMGCSDMSHLLDCQLHKCPDGFIKCPHDYCIPVYYINDGIMDCRYGEDETQNIDLNGHGYFMCNSGTTFLHPNNICDGEKQCLDGADELNCNQFCPEGFKCEGLVAYSNNVEYFNVNNNLNFAYLNITNAPVPLLNGTIFHNLYKLVWSNCSVLNTYTPSPKGARFTYLRLYYLDLSYNKFLEIIKNNIFLSFPNLRFLNLSHNNDLHTFKLGETWPDRLNTLDLSYTKISVLHLPVNDEKYPMKFLNLYKSKIINLGWLQNIKYLEHLDIRETLLTNDVLRPDDLSNISIKVSLQTDMFKLCCPSYRGPGVPAHVCISPVNAVSSCEDLLSDTLKRALLWMVAAISFVGNVTVIYYRLFHDRRVFKKAYGVFVTNLGISDLLMGAYLILIAAVDVHYRNVYVINETYWRHSDLCKAAGFLSTVSSETSTFFIFLITVDRFLVMRYPFGNHVFKKWSITLSVILTWCAGIIMALLPLTFDSWELYSSNGLCLGMPLTVSRLDGWSYSFAIFIVLNLCMFLLIALGQVAIFRSMTSSRDNLANSHDFDRRVQDVAVAKKLSLVVLSNFICWFPICVTGLRSKLGVEPNPETLAWLLVFVLPLNAAVNPMIYTIPAVYNKWQEFKQASYHFTRRPNIART